MLCLLIFVSAAADPGGPLSRIAVRKGAQRSEFYSTDTGRVFIPEGTSYVKDIGEFHAGLYNPEEAESALTQMRLFCGYNIVRIFVANGPHTNNGIPYEGVGGDVNSTTPQLSPAYMANIIDFMQRATRHRIYVLPVLAWVPYSTYYIQHMWEDRPVNLADPERTSDVNAFYLYGKAIEAKQQYVRSFIDAIRAVDPSLLSTIFAYEIENEVYLEGNKPPFSLNSGLVHTADGQSYDMGNAVSRQQCMDANIVNWANSVAWAIRQSDPDALVSASVFTYRAAGKTGPNGLRLPYNWKVIGSDTRFPASPAIMSIWASALSYIDIHLYPTSSYNIDNDLASSQFSAISKRTPLLLGEFGAELLGSFTPAKKAIELGKLRSNAYDRGFLGSLFWTWRTAVEDPGAFNGVLAPSIRATASSSWPTMQPYLAFDGDTATAWNAGGGAPQWIQIDLGRTRTISKITLTPDQSPAGVTRHELTGGLSLANMNQLGTIKRYTESGRPITLSFSSPRKLRYIRITTKVSPSWVGWQDISVQDAW